MCYCVGFGIDPVTGDVCMQVREATPIFTASCVLTYVCTLYLFLEMSDVDTELAGMLLPARRDPRLILLSDQIASRDQSRWRVRHRTTRSAHTRQPRFGVAGNIVVVSCLGIHSTLLTSWPRKVL